MKELVVFTVVGLVIFMFCSTRDENPFFSEYNTPFQTPPFHLIKTVHYMPAFKEGMKQQRAEIKQIVKNPQVPTFENTIEAFERSDALLTKVDNVFDNMRSALTNDELQIIAKEVAPLLSKHSDDIFLDEGLFKRVKTVYENRAEFNLNQEQKMLLTETYKAFVRGGANLPEDKKAEFREINKELSLLSIQFGENVLEEDNAFELLIEDENDLAGLTEAIITSAAEAANERGHSGKWVITLHKPSFMPFLQFSEKRELREKVFKAYINRANNSNEYDNKEILKKMVDLRLKRAKLLGYETHASFILEENMAKNSENVYGLLTQIWKPALRKAKRERAALQTLIDEEGHSFKLQPWDWWYYAEKLKKQKYDLDEEIMKPYFKMENVREGAFMVANKLWGITFEERTDIPVYHPDVKVFEVKEADGTHIGIYFTDYFPRASKRGGAWMSSYRKQYRLDDRNFTPIITNVGNFTKPIGEVPSLLRWEEVETLFHEFGHALHGLLSDRTYQSLTGTSVPRDFVELPSQIMENWASEPQVLKMYARHYQTDEPIPDELIQKIQNTSKFNQGFVNVEKVSAAFLDMDWHTLTEPTDQKVLEFEENSLNKIGLIPEIVVRYRSPNFRHIFAGGYSAGYYSYMWAEVLDADAFQAFKENGIFDRETGNAYRKNILAAGGTEDPMVLYRRFRGKDPSVQPLLDRRGLN
ncbi:MAG: M3 family metallopeptidase [Calditrichia bacterium]|nr:M3 family metallopeptidase [Calditrichia bacterium]